VTGLAKVGDGRNEEHPPQIDPGTSRFGFAHTTMSFLRKPAADSKLPLIKGLTYDSYVYVADYFLKKYGITADGTLPLVNLGNRDRAEYMLAERCKLASGQLVKARLSPDEQASMIRFACRDAPANAISITTKARELLSLDRNSLLASFGLSVSEDLITVKGRQLVPPRVTYKNKGTASLWNGGWDMRDLQVVRTGSPITNWSCLYPAERATDTVTVPKIRKAVMAFAAHCRKIGLNINPAPSVARSMRFEPRIDEKTVTATLEGVKDTQFVLVVLPYKDTALYNLIKKVAEVDVGVMTVCVL
jgi:hypothetical protein